MRKPGADPASSWPAAFLSVCHSGPGRDYTLFGKTLFDLLDYLTSNLMMPLFGLVLTLLLGWKLGTVLCLRISRR